MNARVWSSWSWCVPPVETQVVSIVPLGHPCLSTSPSAYLSPISFPFSLFLFFSLFFLFPFAVLRFPVPFRLFVSRMLRVSPSLDFFRFPARLGGRLSSFVSVLHPPRAAFEPANRRIILACASFLACYVFMFFFSSLPFSISIWTSFVFILSFSCGYYVVSSVSVSAATRLAYDIPWYVSWSVRTPISPFYFCPRCTICFSYCVYYLLFLFVFLLR